MDLCNELMTEILLCLDGHSFGIMQQCITVDRYTITKWQYTHLSFDQCVACNYQDAVDLYLRKGHKPTNDALEIAIKHNNCNLVSRLLHYPEIVPTYSDVADARSFEVLFMLLSYGQDYDMRRLFEDVVTEDTITFQRPTSILLLLFKKSGLTPNEAFNIASVRRIERRGYLLQGRPSRMSHLNEFVAFLLQDPQIDPSSNDYRIQRFIMSRNDVSIDIVNILLNDSRLNSSPYWNEALCMQCWKGNIEIVKLLLKDQRFHPSIEGEPAFATAVYYRNLELVKLLLKDPRTDPNRHCASQLSMYNLPKLPIRIASTNGDVSIVRLLLNDPRLVIKDYDSLIDQLQRWTQTGNLKDKARSAYIEIIRMLKAHQQRFLYRSYYYRPVRSNFEVW